jgi:hypothetical protein
MPTVTSRMTVLRDAPAVGGYRRDERFAEHPTPPPRDWFRQSCLKLFHGRPGARFGGTWNRLHVRGLPSAPYCLTYCLTVG